MNILNGTEAFAALMAGRNILCRAVGELIDFDDLDQFPATVFAKSGYEFCIKIETMELADITFEKPLILDDVQLGDDVYIIQASGEIHHYKYEVCHEILNQSIARGFAQRDQSNAQLQSEAFCKLFDRVYRQADIVEMNTQIKTKRRSRKSKEDEQEETIDLEKMFETILSNIAVSTTEQEVLQSCFSLYQYGFSDDRIAAIESAKTSRLKEVDEQYFNETDPAVHKFIEAIEKCKSDYELQGVERNLEGNKGKLHESEYEELSKRVSAKRESFFSTSTKTQPVKTKELGVDELKRLQVEAEKLIQPDTESTEKAVLVDDDAVYQEHLKVLLNDVALAQTPTEANALLKYTKHWTAEQRTPVIQVINKRLVELNPIAEIKIEETPFLMVQIQNSPDLTALDVLEIDVGSRHPDIQPKLMSCVTKRRFELENGISPLEASL